MVVDRAALVSCFCGQYVRSRSGLFSPVIWPSRCVEVGPGYFTRAVVRRVRLLDRKAASSRARQERTYGDIASCPLFPAGPGISQSGAALIIPVSKKPPLEEVQIIPI